MNIFHEEHIEILKILIQHQVQFIMIGGVAVNFYGYYRPTGDVDIWLKPDDENKNKLILVLKEFNINEEDITQVMNSDFTKPTAFHIGNKPPFVVDFITKIVGVRWEEAWEMKVDSEIEGIKVSVIHINHLIQNKLIAGRPKDLDDIQKLNRIEILRRGM